MASPRLFGPAAAVLSCLGFLASFGLGQTGDASAPRPIKDAYFSEELYPVLEEAQCRLCHTDAGVASGSRLKFPHETAGRDEIRKFGKHLAVFVDRREPRASLLFRKPTNRLEHSGGERIPKGSDKEEILLTWVSYLATLHKGANAITEGTSPPSAEEDLRPSIIRRLTHTQYNNTVRDLLGDLTRPASQFPPEDFVHGFRNQTAGQSISLLLAEAYSAAAEKLAHNAFRGGDHHHLLPCRPVSAADTACRVQFIKEFGQRAFRRPLIQPEIEKYQEIFDEGARKQGAGKQGVRKQGAFLAGARLVIEATLQSPHFLFRVERGGQGTSYSYEMANRLSYFLWNTMPDNDLFRTAERGELVTPDQVEATARRMLRDPRAKAAMEEFLSQWLRFDRLSSAIRDRRLFPDFSSQLTAAMAEETKRLFNHLVWDNVNFMEFFSADYSYLNSELADLYGLPGPAEEFGLVRFPPSSGRAGVLGQPMFLTLTGKPMDTSPTDRGLYIREQFLCQSVPPPPPGVNATLPPVTDAKPMTNRELLQSHLTNPGCASCHRLIDPIGFGFEQYDTLGRFREKHFLTIFPTRDEAKKKRKTEATKYELPIDPSGEVRGIAVKDGVSHARFSSPKDLGLLLASEPACQKCIARQMFQYALGRPETEADRETIREAFDDFRDSQFRFQELIISIVGSEPFLGSPN
jgi:hypothetical protein